MRKSANSSRISLLNDKNAHKNQVEEKKTHEKEKVA